jgi:hypothetical protein
VVQCEVSADLLCRKYWAERGQGEHKSARALKRENARAQERLRGRKEGINVGVRCEKGRMMWKQGSVEQMADERCGWRIGRKARRRESKKVLGAKSYST